MSRFRPSEYDAHPLPQPPPSAPSSSGIQDLTSFLGSIASGYTSTVAPAPHRPHVPAVPRVPRTRPQVPLISFPSESERLAAISKQLCFYFAAENYYTDQNLLELADKRDGFVPINSILYFKKMVAMDATREDIKVLFQSDPRVREILEYTEDYDWSIRRRVKDNLPEWKATQRRMVYFANLYLTQPESDEAVRQDYIQFFTDLLRRNGAPDTDAFRVTAVRFFKYDSDSKYIRANVLFSSAEAADNVISLGPYDGPFSDAYKLYPEPVSDEKGTLWRPENNWQPRSRPNRGGRGRGRGRGDRGRGGRGDFGGGRGRQGDDFGFRGRGDFGRGGGGFGRGGGDFGRGGGDFGRGGGDFGRGGGDFGRGGGDFGRGGDFNRGNSFGRGDFGHDGGHDFGRGRDFNPKHERSFHDGYDDGYNKRGRI